MVNTANDVEAMYRRVDFEDWDGDAPSNLDDPSIYGKAGETYRVRLLIGKDYVIEGDQPFDIVAKSDARIAVMEYGMNQAEVVWPVTFTVAEGRAPTGRPRLGATWNDGGKSFYVMPNPSWLRGATWTDNYCCDVWGDGTNFTYACDNTCTCEGCTVYGSYWYEGYGLPVWGIPCGCHYVPDHGPFEVMQFGFDKSAAIYEDAYTNMPGVVIHPTPSNVVLRCEVYGGTYGGRLTIALNAAGRSKIARVGGNLLPNSVEIPPDTTRVFETEYTPLEPSGTVNDIVATATYVENFRNESHTATATLTSVKVELEAKYAPPISADLLNRHLFGVYEVVKYRHLPSAASVDWEFVKGSQILTQTQYVGDGEVFLCPSRGGSGTARASCGSVDYIAHFSVIEPSVEARNIRVNVSDVVGERGHAGQLLMFMDMYLLPSHVSFKGLWIQEVPDNSQGGDHSGYYDDQSKGGDWSHVADQNYGAGRWNETSASGYCGTDKAGTARSYAPEWTYGWKEWDIPMAWAADGNGEGSEMFIPNPTTQKFTLWPDGTFKIEKHNHWAQRTIWNSYTIDGIGVLEEGF